jgi:small conductance mechanosensitive channel
MSVCLAKNCLLPAGEQQQENKMEDLNVVHGINNAGGWLVRNQELLLSYVVNIVAAIAIIIVGMIVARLISNALNKVLLARHIDATVADFLSALVRYGIIAFTLIAALGRVGVQTASVIAVLGAAGLAIGLALQGSLANLAAGVLLVTFRPFRTGEFIDIGVMGTVQSVQIFSTTLKTADGKIVVVPNGKIIAGNIVNFSREPVRRNEFIIGVAYDADVDQVIKLLQEVVDAEPRVLRDMGIQIGLNELAASSVNFVVRCWSNAGDLQNVYWDLMKNFKRTLDAHQIGIPYPQMDVHLHQVKSAEDQQAEAKTATPDVAPSLPKPE